jgi:hypothetical protein
VVFVVGLAVVVCPCVWGGPSDGPVWDVRYRMDCTGGSDKTGAVGASDRLNNTGSCYFVPCLPAPHSCGISDRILPSVGWVRGP